MAKPLEARYYQDVGGEQFRGGDSDFTSVKVQQWSGWAGLDGGAHADGASCCNRFKFVLWAAVVAGVAAAIIGLSVTMVIIKRNDHSEAAGGVVPGQTPGSQTPGTSGQTAAIPGSPGVVDPLVPSSQPGLAPPPTDGDGQLHVMTNPPFAPTPGWTPLWWDEFDGTALNPQWWSADVGYGQTAGLWEWGNGEQEYYTTSPDNLLVANGLLSLTARQQQTVLPDGFTFNYTSARINTQGKLGVFGGMKTADGRVWGTIRIEASLKAPQQTEGLWAAFWMLPIDMRYGVWASSGEIDFYEMKNEFANINMAVHFGGPYPKYQKQIRQTPRREGGGSFSDSFAPFSAEWSTTSMVFNVDGVNKFSARSRSVDPNGWYSLGQDAGPNSPFDMPFYFVINLAVGGKYPGNVTDASVFPNSLLVDYIRVYGKP